MHRPGSPRFPRVVRYTALHPPGALTAPLSSKVYSSIQSGNKARRLHKVADELSHLKSINSPILKQQLADQAVTKKAAERVGAGTATGVGMAAGGMTSELLNQKTKEKNENR